MPATTPWITVTPADVKACVLAELLDLTNARATANAQGDPFTVHAPRAVARVRAKVASYPRNRLSADPSLVPPELADQTATLIALAIVRSTATTRPALLDNFKDAIAQVEKDLDNVAAGKLAVSLPPDAEAPGTGTVQASGTVSVVGGNPRLSTREEMRGL